MEIIIYLLCKIEIIQTNIIGPQSGGVSVDLEGEAEGNPTYDGTLWGIGEYKVPVIKYSPEAIFANRVPILNANFLRPASTNTNTANPEDNMLALRNVVAGWYVAIRMISIIGLLSVLVYLSIRMMLSGVAADKAKYKKMLMSWVVAMCLLFFLHYLMSFIMTLSETITSFVSTAGDTAINVNVGNGETEFSTNMIGLARFQVQHTDAMFKIAYMVIYIMMVFYTLKFTWVYLKRMVSMAFLTLIAPLIALTYPIDKAGDGKAQGFDMWIKEYLYNALVQPLHCLLYVIFATATIQLSKTNPLIAVMIFPLMGYAEKFLKSLLGFTKASGGTVPSMAGAVGAHALGTMVGNLAKRGRAGIGPGGGKPRTAGQRGGGVTVGAPNDLDDINDVEGLIFNDGTLQEGDGNVTNSNDGNQNGQNGQNGPDSGNNGGRERADSENTGNQNRENDSNIDELIRQQEEILNDPNATDEDIANAQELLDYYQGNTGTQPTQDEELARQRQEWQAGNTESARDNWTYTPPEPTTIGEAIGRDLTSAGEYIGGRISGVAGRIRGGIGNTRRFLTNEDGYRNEKIAEAKDTAKQKANSMALAGYNGIKRNLKGAAYAAKPLAYKTAKGVFSAGVRGTAAAVTGAATFAAGAVATGDLSQAATLAGTAAGGTYYGLGKATKAVAGRQIEDFEVAHNLSTDYKSAFERGKYGSEAKAANAREQREWEHSDEFNQFLRAKCKTKEDIEATRSAMIEYHKLGVKDDNEAYKLYKAEAAVQKNLQQVGGQRPTRREMVSAMKAEAKADSRAWTNDDVYKKTKASYVNRFSGTQAEKEKKATRKMELARIIHYNK